MKNVLNLHFNKIKVQRERVLLPTRENILLVKTKMARIRES